MNACRVEVCDAVNSQRISLLATSQMPNVIIILEATIRYNGILVGIVAALGAACRALGVRGLPVKKRLFVLIFAFIAGFGFAQKVLLEGNGKLTDGDIQLDEGQFIDWYDLSLSADEAIEVRVASLDFAPLIRLRTLRGEYFSRESSGGYAVVVSPSKARGLVQIGVSSSKPLRVGNYIFKVQVMLPPEPLQLGVPVQADLSLSSQTSEWGSPVNWHELDVRVGMMVQVVMESEDFDTVLFVEAPSLPGGEYRMLENDDVLDTGNSGLIFQATGDGLARVGASAYSEEDSGLYSLLADVLQPQRVVVAGDQINGQLTGSDSRLFGGKIVDWYLLGGEIGSKVEVRLESDNYDTYLVLHPGAGELLENDDAGDDSSNSLLTHTFFSEEPVLVGATSYSSEVTGGYLLSIELGEGDAQDVQIAPQGVIVEMTPNVVYKGVLTAQDLSQDERYTDTFIFEASGGEYVTISLDSDEFDAYLTFVSPNGDEMTSDDFGETSNSRITTSLNEPGRYRIIASSYDGGAIGGYFITLRIIEGEYLVYEGELSEGDAQSIFGEYYDMYTFEAVEGEEVTVRMTSGELDSKVGVFSSTGFFLGYNDDASDDDPGSAITVTIPETGSYSIFASSYDATEVGSYQITVIKASEGGSIEDGSGSSAESPGS